MVANTWIAAGPGDWDDDGNWSLGHSPIAGEDPTFDGTSVNNCNANDDTPTGVLTIAAGYTGTIIQSSDMYISGYSQSGGTFTGDTMKWIYLSGNFVKNAGSMTAWVTNLNIIGNSVHSTTGGGQIHFRTVKINDAFKFTAGGGGSNYINVLSFINNGILEIPTGTFFNNYCGTGHGYINNGTIYSNGSFNILLNSFDITINMGIINGNLYVKNPYTSGDRTLILNSNCDNYLLKIYIVGITKLASIDPNGHNLTADSITVGPRGILQCGEGTITTTSLDSSAGTITPETATWVFDDAATVNVAAGQELHSVIVKDRLKLLSNLGIEQALAHTNPVDLNGFALTLDRPDNEYTSIRRPMRRAIRKLDLGPMGALDRWMTDLGGVV